MPYRRTAFSPAPASSEHLAQLADKLNGYARLAEIMLRYHQQVPLQLFCFLTPRREQTARSALAASAGSLSLRITTAAIDPRVTCPAGQVWMPLNGSDRQVRLIVLDDNPFQAALPGSAADRTASQPPESSSTTRLPSTPPR